MMPGSGNGSGKNSNEREDTNRCETVGAVSEKETVPFITALGMVGLLSMVKIGHILILYIMQNRM